MKTRVMEVQVTMSFCANNSALLRVHRLQILVETVILQFLNMTSSLNSLLILERRGEGSVDLPLFVTADKPRSPKIPFPYR